MANRKLGRPTDQRMALLRNQVTNLIWYGRIETTLTRAKEVRSMAERLITVAMRECDNTVELKKETKNDKQQIVVLDVVKQAEDSGDIVLRMYECLGASCKAHLRTGFDVAAASVCDLLERVTAPLTVEGEDIALEFEPFEIKTVILTPASRADAR